MNTASPPNQQTVPTTLISAAERFGDTEAVVDHLGGREIRLTYRQLLERVRELARLLLAEGVRPGDRIALNSPNTHHWVIAALAILHVGAVLVPINTRFTAVETRDVLDRSAARGLIVAGSFLGRDRLAELMGLDEQGDNDLLPGLPALGTVLRLPVESTERAPIRGVVDWDNFQDRASSVSLAQVDEAAAAVESTDVSDVLYTSGTTGQSKGVLSAHHQVLSVADAWASCGEMSSNDRYLVVNPFFHSFGYKAGILVCLLRGATIVPLPVFNTGDVMDLVHRERITVLPGPPTLYQSIMDEPSRAQHDLSCLRLAVTGAATVPIVLVERMQRDLSFSSVLTAYGLTEAVVATMCRPDDDATTIATTCGRPTAGFELRIADTEGNPLPQDTVGEVLLRGPNTMLGYRDNPELTDSTIDSEGWLHTGDLGRVDAHGYLTITDRLKDMYISGGFNVYPAEVEQAIARLAGVVECAVVGVADPRLGEVGKCYLVVGSGYDLSIEEVLEFCRQRLANYKIPREVEFRSSLPRNPSGKVVKHELA